MGLRRVVESFGLGQIWPMRDSDADSKTARSGMTPDSFTFRLMRTRPLRRSIALRTPKIILHVSRQPLCASGGDRNHHQGSYALELDYRFQVATKPT